MSNLFNITHCFPYSHAKLPSAFRHAVIGALLDFVPLPHKVRLYQSEQSKI